MRNLQGTTQLDVLSFNLRYGTADDGENSWQFRKDIVCQTIREIDPDIIGLQEALRFQIDEIREALPQYDEIGVGRDDGKTKGEYSAILYKSEDYQVIESETFWFSDTPFEPGTADWGNSIPRICTWGYFNEQSTGTSFYIYNLHLDHRSQPSRERSAVFLSEQIAQRENQDPFVITGDLNAGEDNPAILYLKGERKPGENSGKSNPVPVEDTFRELHPDATGVGTFNGFEGESDGAKIDYVLVPSYLNVIQAQIIDRSYDGHYPSDHYPVFARIAIPINSESQERGFRKYLGGAQ